MTKKPSLAATKLLTLFLSFAFCPSVLSAESARVVYDQLERIQNDTKALHEIRAPSWVNAPNMRGTSSILYSCVLTLVACIYTALHLNIPHRNATFSQLLMIKMKWVLIALIAPELVVWLAAEQYAKARSVSKWLRLKEWEQFGSVAQQEAGRLSRAFRAMRFWVSGGPSDGEDAAVRVVGLEEHTFDLKYGFFAVMGGFELESAKSIDGEPITAVLSSKGIKWLAERYIQVLKVPRTHILDGTRKAYGLPLCLLELHTMVHVICAIVMYIFWMEKPLNLTNFEKIQVPQTIIDDLYIAHRKIKGPYEDGLFYPERSNVPGFHASWFVRDWHALTQWATDELTLLQALALALPIMYGGVHLAAWGFEFPTAAEAMAWKVASIIIASAFPSYATVVALVAFGISFSLSDQHIKVGKSTIITSLGILLFVITVSRVFLVLESFISLRSVPIGVYWTPSWLQMIPHV
ncbi:hypothetical protein QBC43DRAFT_305070 [Cladorrhinum sp. PSN259]|nr:hypothetical protein QBC43DRAFT_305070 [Cladorrhinum sp. PSN259]